MVNFIRVTKAINRALASVDYNIYNDINKQFQYRRQSVLTDESLTKDERLFAARMVDRIYDGDKILYNTGTKRICEDCNQECLATLYCEYCVRNYLEKKVSNYTLNHDIDDLIKSCQKKALMPNMIVEWIPYNKLQNIKYLTEGGFSEIYTASWIDGRYDEWDSNERKLKRIGRHDVVLKKLENVNQRWREEVCYKIFKKS
jgi:hypothetical protein